MSHAGGRERWEALLVQDGSGILGRKDKRAVVTAPSLASPRAGLPVLSPERLACSTSGHTRRCSEHCYSKQHARSQTDSRKSSFPSPSPDCTPQDAKTGAPTQQGGGQLKKQPWRDLAQGRGGPGEARVSERRKTGRKELFSACCEGGHLGRDSADTQQKAAARGRGLY